MNIQNKNNVDFKGFYSTIPKEDYDKVIRDANKNLKMQFRVGESHLKSVSEQFSNYMAKMENYFANNENVDIYLEHSNGQIISKILPKAKRKPNTPGPKNNTFCSPLVAKLKAFAEQNIRYGKKLEKTMKSAKQDS